MVASAVAVGKHGQRLEFLAWTRHSDISSASRFMGNGFTGRYVLDGLPS